MTAAVAVPRSASSRRTAVLVGPGAASSSSSSSSSSSASLPPRLAPAPGGCAPSPSCTARARQELSFMECALAAHLGVAVEVSEMKQSAPHAPCGKARTTHCTAPAHRAPYGTGCKALSAARAQLCPSLRPPLTRPPLVRRARSARRCSPGAHARAPSTTASPEPYSADGGEPASRGAPRAAAARRPSRGAAQAPAHAWTRRSCRPPCRPHRRPPRARHRRWAPRWRPPPPPAGARPACSSRGL